MTKTVYGSTMEALRHLAEHSSASRDDLYRLIAANHASKNGMREVFVRLLRGKFIKTNMVHITDAGRKALESATEKQE